MGSDWGTTPWPSLRTFRGWEDCVYDVSWIDAAGIISRDHVRVYICTQRTLYRITKLNDIVHGYGWPADVTACGC